MKLALTERRLLLPFLIAMAMWSSAAAQDPAEPAIEGPVEEVAAENDVDAPAPPQPPSNLRASDVPNDAGRAIELTWDLSPDDDPELEEPLILGYRLYRAPFDPAIPADELVFERIFDTQDLTVQSNEWTDEKNVRPHTPYLYRLTTVGVGDVESLPAELDQPVEAIRWFFDRNKSWFLVLTIIISAGIILFIYVAQRGVPLKIRRIAGLEAVDEAVGRATEMGRSILFVPGIQDMNNIQTVAGMTILARIGRTAAEYDARIEVPTSRSLVMTTARETLESAYLGAGRPDAYHEDMSYYVTDEQFGYVAYLTGYMVREKPAACFYLGAFFAESLILAETGNSIGAIQVAGTAEPAQLPFFVAACDYTLIGEEFFAASAYLSGEPEQLGTLKGQDVGKIIGGILLIIGCAIATYASITQSEAAERAVRYLMFQMLGTEEVEEEMLDPEAAETSGMGNEDEIGFIFDAGGLEVCTSENRHHAIDDAVIALWQEVAS